MTAEMVYVWGATAEGVEELLADLAKGGRITPLRGGRAVEMMGRDGRYMARAERVADEQPEG